MVMPVQGRTQFLIDALDRAVPRSTSGLDETEAIINRFPINLELDSGTSFTDRTTYTGIYNISGLGFDMSFRVQCSENYYGQNCTSCNPVKGVYTCSTEEGVVCIHDNRDPATNCTTCLSGYDPEQNCSQCLMGRTLSSNCSACPPGYDPSTNCDSCLPRYEITSGGTQCSEAVTQLPSTMTEQNHDRERNFTQCGQGWFTLNVEWQCQLHIDLLNHLLPEFTVSVEILSMVHKVMRALCDNFHMDPMHIMVLPSVHVILQVTV